MSDNIDSVRFICLRVHRKIKIPTFRSAWTGRIFTFYEILDNYANYNAYAHYSPTVLIWTLIYSHFFLNNHFIEENKIEEEYAKAFISWNLAESSECDTNQRKCLRLKKGQRWRKKTSRNRKTETISLIME